MSDPSIGFGVGAPARPTRRRVQGQRHLMNVTRSILFGCLALGIVLGLGAVLPGAAFLMLAGLLVVAVPTSRYFSRRVLIAGSTFLGWVPLMWFCDLSWVIGGRSRLTVALIAGGIVAWWSLQGFHTGLRLIALRLRAVDYLLIAAGVMVAWQYSPYIVLNDAKMALARLLPGWDHSAHFDMAVRIRESGVLTIFAPSPPGGQWRNANYPEGYHAAVAGVMELLHGAVRLSQGATIITYSRAMAIVVVIAVVTTLAALASLPALRKKRCLAFPSLMLLTATLILGPGGWVVYSGFPNFMVAVCMLAAGLVAFSSSAYPARSRYMVLVTLSSVLALAYNWALLVVVVIPPGVMIGLSLICHRRRLNKWGVAFWSCVGCALSIMLLVPLRILGGQAGNLKDLALLGNGVPIPFDMRVLLLASTLALVGPVFAASARSSRRILTVLSVSMFVGLLVAIELGHRRFMVDGTLGYYFWKFAAAMAVVSVAVALVSLIIVWPEGGWLCRTVDRIQFAASLAVGISMLFVYGAPVAVPIDVQLPPSAGRAARSEAIAVGLSLTGDAGSLLQATEAAEQTESLVVLLPFPAAQTTPQALVGAWYLALTGNWTILAHDVTAGQPEKAEQNVDAAVDAARAVFTKHPDAVVVVGPQFAAELRSALGQTIRPDQIRSW